MSKKLSVLVTGAAGFIGFHLSKKLCSLGYTVTGIDNLNEYYDVRLKHSRLEQLKQLPDFTFHQLDLTDKKEIYQNYGVKEYFIVEPTNKKVKSFVLKNNKYFELEEATGFIKSTLLKTSIAF